MYLCTGFRGNFQNVLLTFTLRNIIHIQFSTHFCYNFNSFSIISSISQAGRQFSSSTTNAYQEKQSPIEIHAELLAQNAIENLNSKPLVGILRSNTFRVEGSANPSRGEGLEGSANPSRGEGQTSNPSPSAGHTPFTPDPRTDLMSVADLVSAAQVNQVFCEPFLPKRHLAVFHFAVYVCIFFLLHGQSDRGNTQ